MLDDTLDLTSYDEKFMPQKGSKSKRHVKTTDLKIEQLLKEFDRIEESSQKHISKTSQRKEKKLKLQPSIDDSPKGTVQTTKTPPRGLESRIKSKVKIQLKSPQSPNSPSEYYDNRTPNNFQIHSPCMTEPEEVLGTQLRAKKFFSDLPVQTNIPGSTSRKHAREKINAYQDPRQMHLNLESFESHRITYKNPLLSKKSKNYNEGTTKDSQNSSTITLPSITSPVNAKKYERKVYEFHQNASQNNETKERYYSVRKSNTMSPHLPQLNQHGPQFNVEIKKDQDSYHLEENKLISVRLQKNLTPNRRDPNPLIRFVEHGLSKYEESSPRTFIHNQAFHDNAEDHIHFGNGSDFALRAILDKRSPRVDHSNSGSEASPHFHGNHAAFGFEFASNHVDHRAKRIGKNEDHSSLFRKVAENELSRQIYNE